MIQEQDQLLELEISFVAALTWLVVINFPRAVNDFFSDRFFEKSSHELSRFRV